MTVKISFRDFASWIKQAKLVAASDDPPDVFARQPGLPARRRAREGRADPAARPSTPRPTAGTSPTRPRRCSSSCGPTTAQTFGEGTLWGVAQSGQSIGVFANKKKLDAAGVDPASLEDVRRLRRRAGQAARVAAGRRAGDRARQQGPVRRAPPVGRDPGRLHAGAGHARLDLPRATARRSTPRATSQSLEKLKEWADKGYLGQGDSFNARNDSEAAAAFGKGEGALHARRQLERRDRHATASARTPIVLQHAARRERRRGRDRLGERADAHLGQDRSSRTSRPRTSTSSPGRTPAQALVDTQQVPAATDATAEPGDPLGKEVKDGLGRSSSRTAA